MEDPSDKKSKASEFDYYVHRKIVSAVQAVNQRIYLEGLRDLQKDMPRRHWKFWPPSGWFLMTSPYTLLCTVIKTLGWAIVSQPSTPVNYLKKKLFANVVAIKIVERKLEKFINANTEH